MDEKLIRLLRQYDNGDRSTAAFQDPRTFLDRVSVRVVAKNIVDIIVESDGELPDDAIDVPESLADVVRSWCRPSRLPGFDFDEALESAIRSISDREDFAFVDRRSNRSSLPSSEWRSDDYVVRKQNERDEKSYVFERFEASSADPEFRFGEPVALPSPTNEKSVFVRRESRDAVPDRSKIVLDLGYSLMNLERFRCASELLGKVACELDVDDDVSKRFLIEVYEKRLVSKPVRASIQERVPFVTEKRLLEIVDRLSDVELKSDLDYNVSTNFDALVGTVYEEIKARGFVELCEDCAASKTAFRHLWKILGTTFIGTRYDFRILALIKNCVVVIGHLFEYEKIDSEIACFDDLFERKHDDLVCLLEFGPDVLSGFPEAYEKTLDGLRRIYVDDPFECMMYLCRFIDWFGAFDGSIAKRSVSK